MLFNIIVFLWGGSLFTTMYDPSTYLLNACQSINMMKIMGWVQGYLCRTQELVWEYFLWIKWFEWFSPNKEARRLSAEAHVFTVSPGSEKSEALCAHPCISPYFLIYNELYIKFII